MLRCWCSYLLARLKWLGLILGVRVGHCWRLFASAFDVFGDPVLEDRFLAKQLPGVARFFANALLLQVLAALLFVVWSLLIHISSRPAAPLVALIIEAGLLLRLCLVRGLLLFSAYFVLKRSGHQCSCPRVLLLASGVVLAVVLAIWTVEDHNEAFADRCLTSSSSLGDACHECWFAPGGLSCQGRNQSSTKRDRWEASAAKLVLIHCLLGLAGLFSCIPMRYFASSWLVSQAFICAVPSLRRTLFVTASIGNIQTFDFLCFCSLSALMALAASTRAERQNRFLFLLSSAHHGEHTGRMTKQPVETDSNRMETEFEFGLEAASTLLLDRLCRHAQLQSAAYELFDAVVSVDMSRLGDGKTLFAEASSTQELRRLAVVLAGDASSGAVANDIGGLPGRCFEDFLTADASHTWRCYAEHRSSEGCRQGDAPNRVAAGRGSESIMMRLQLAGCRQKELLALLSPPPSSGAFALLCLRTVSDVEHVTADGGIFGAGVFGDGAVTKGAHASELATGAQATLTASTSCAHCQRESESESCDCGNGQLLDCLPPKACVWVQGADTPTPLSDVKPGMKILTVDPQRSPSISFDPVRKIAVMADHDDDVTKKRDRRELSDQLLGSQERWLRISLADGSEVIMTASHPMWPEGTHLSSGYSLGALKAEDLVPGVDSLVSLCARRVVVKHVAPIPPEDSPAGRVALELGSNSMPQIDGDGKSRRALFLTLPQDAGGSAAGGCFVGVGDSVVKAASNRFDALEEIDGDTASLTGTTRSGSLPSTTSGFGEEANTGGGRRKEREEDVEVILGSIDECSGWRRSRPEGEWHRCLEADAARTVRLSDVRALPRNAEGGLLSYGSIGHAVKNEACKVCVFQRKNGVSCRNGWACTFCHAWHQPYVRPRRPDKRRALHATGSVDGDAASEDTRASRDDGKVSAPAVGNDRPREEPMYVNPGGAPTVNPGGAPAVPKIGSTTGIVSGRFSA